MRILLASLLSLFAVLGASLGGLAGEPTRPLSPQAETLRQRLATLQARPDDPVVQRQYLEAFPKDIGSFTRLFAPPDFGELYSGSYKYILPLGEIAQTQPETVGRLLIGLSKDAHYDADALSYLQSVSAKYAATHTATFVKLLRTSSRKEVSKLIRYLADVENHDAYLEYPRIIENLRRLGEQELADRFEAARRERMRRRTH